jgi:hypothetical protein
VLSVQSVVDPPKQQEIVVDYLRNLATSPFFVVNPKTPERVITSNSVPKYQESGRTEAGG